VGEQILILRQVWADKF